MLKEDSEFSLPKLEERVLNFWRTDKTFEKASKKGGKTFVFFEGPPTANGKPGIHHILARSFKDIIPRYKTMRGYKVPRKGGWDTHGLPVEIEAEKQLGLKSKKEIEAYGIAAFNKKCKESVWQYKDEWEKLTERIGFWLDMKNPYVTYENEYVESVWWILKEVWKKKLLYKGHKVVPWCSRCGTGLSSHELALGYKEVTDNSVFVKFKLLPNQKIGNFTTDEKTFVLSWTTTPWTLPGNVALAVGKNIEYVNWSVGTGESVVETYIAAVPYFNRVGVQAVVPNKFLGKDLVGLEYQPLFEVKNMKTAAAYKIYPADFVTTTDGTGVVHTAVMYGEDDYQLGIKVGLPQRHTVDEAGRFTVEVKDLAGLPVKNQETEKKIFSYLTEKGFLFKVESYKHEYPFCWRCNTPLLYYARESWFIGMSKEKSKLMAANKKINWLPAHLKTGRFGEWISGVKDWAISRSRYWGTPLPIWECAECGELKVVGSFAELEKESDNKKTPAKFIFIRHGEAENNTKNITCGFPETIKRPLTLKGRAQTEKLAKSLKKIKPDMLFSSDLVRTKQTADILADKLGMKIVLDERLREIDFGDFNNRKVEEYFNLFSSELEKYYKAAPGGENMTQIRARINSFIQEINKKYSGKTILVVTHGHPAALAEQIMLGLTDKQVAEKIEAGKGFLNAEARTYKYRVLPQDETGLFDIHRPFVDGVKIPCHKCKGEMKRVPEVLDVWFDSGAMPYAQAHYPFDKKQKASFAADYISEGVDQTRGWFYTLLAISTLLGKPSAYKNVVSLGLVLDKNGQKMSKSKGNVVNPWEMIEKYGADSLRWYFYTVNPPGESKKFDEIDLGKVSRQFVSLIYNSFVFYETYADKNAKASVGGIKSKNILDKWVMSRLNQTITEATKKLESYEIGEAARLIEVFAGDMSRWYIRRSRRRLQRPEDKKDYAAASATLKLVLGELAKLLAPFMPFFAEGLHRSLGNKTSVHMADWPKASGKSDAKLLLGMEEVRDLATKGLAARASAAIKVRQPLASLTVPAKDSKIKTQKEILEILKEEVNVKQIKFGSVEGLELDTNITPELKAEGLVREFVRLVQDLRQDAKLNPSHRVEISLVGDKGLETILDTQQAEIKRMVGADRIIFKRTEKHTAQIETKLEDKPLWLAIRKL